MDRVQRAAAVGDGSDEAGPAGEAAAADPFRLKGGGFTLLVFEPLDLRVPDLFRRLMDRLAQAANMKPQQLKAEFGYLVERDVRTSMSPLAAAAPSGPPTS